MDNTLGTMPKVHADEDRVKEIIYNLIGNALKFTEKGEVRVVMKKNRHMLEVRVVDTGKGIPLQSQSLLFRKFQQAQNNILTRDNTRGTGLGLYISKLLAQGMKGEIILEQSVVDKGSTFLLTLPLAK